MKKVRKYVMTVVLILSFIPLKAQDISFRFLKTESDLKDYFTQLYNSENDKTTDSLNNIVFDVFSTALLNPESFSFKWNKLDMIGRVFSPDGRLNIYTWYVKNQKGSYRYHGFIQYNIGSSKKPEIRFYNLDDKSKGMQNPETKSLNPENWLGCVYFSVHQFSYRKMNYYTLFGYNFNNDFSDKKYIEVLTFDKDGLPSFEGDFKTDYQNIKRIILEYSAQLVVSVKYDENLQMIVTDHLAPLEPMFKDNYRFYGPDGSYDGYKFHKGTFELQKDVDARNIQKKDKK